MPMEKADKIGTSLSAALHLGVIAWVALGGTLLRPKPADPIQMTEVSVMSQAAYDAMIAAAPRPAEGPVNAPQAPEPDRLPPPSPAPEAALSPPEPTPALEVPRAEPEPTVTDISPPVTEVSDVAPTPPLPPVEVPSPQVLPDISLRPEPRPVPRVAPTPAEAPPPDVQMADVATTPAAPQETPEPEPVPEPEQQLAAPPEATTQIVTEATRTVDRPQSSAPLSSPRPQARPALPTTQPRPEPARPTPQPQPSQADAVAAALAEALAAPAAPGAGGQGNAPIGPPLTSGQIDGLRRAIQSCWIVGAASSDTLSSVVVVGITMKPDGTPADVRQISAQGPSEAGRTTAFDIARRTVLRCIANAQLPVEQYEQWREIELEFDYNNMRLR